jgi:hypothetical protein
LRIANCPLPIAHCQFPIPNSQFPIIVAHIQLIPLPTVSMRIQQSDIPTTSPSFLSIHNLAP